MKSFDYHCRRLATELVTPQRFRQTQASETAAFIEPISAKLLRDATYTADALRIEISDGKLTVGPSSLPLSDDD